MVADVGRRRCLAVVGDGRVRRRQRPLRGRLADGLAPSGGSTRWSRISMRRTERRAGSSQSIGAARSSTPGGNPTPAHSCSSPWRPSYRRQVSRRSSLSKVDAAARGVAISGAPLVSLAIAVIRVLPAFRVAVDAAWKLALPSGPIFCEQYLRVWSIFLVSLMSKSPVKPTRLDRPPLPGCYDVLVMGRVPPARALLLDDCSQKVGITRSGAVRRQMERRLKATRKAQRLG